MFGKIIKYNNYPKTSQGRIYPVEI